ncbi:hypothetical protein SCP_0607960 [Sparassis crispa]|uniref:Helicase ATP-binding domain-containing protein n=1 Tax=Sparassis crispa TaxID=139825 RepID=A0A401GRH3_9APHY|nr:hypothetical protein SCP_0607960 [Sparassis crispa]GBE84816.1 hypothetical protein SCP_0607960 [Sparassis crispa]
MGYALLCDSVLYYEAWQWPGWRDLTGMDSPPHELEAAARHSAGISWSKKEMNEFEQYYTFVRGAATSGDLKDKIMDGKKLAPTVNQGRKLWQDLWARLLRKSGLNRKIDDLMQQHHCDYRSVSVAFKTRELPGGHADWTSPYLPELGAGLLGGEVLVDHRLMNTTARLLMKEVLYFAWERQTRRAKIWVKNYGGKKTAVDDAWDAFKGGKKKGRALLTLMQKLKDFHDHAQYMNDPEAEQDVEERLKHLESVLGEAGKELRPGAKNSAKLSAADRKRMLSLVTEQELEEVYRQYVELFVEGPMRADATDDAAVDVLGAGDNMTDDLGTDLGVEPESKMTRQALMESMGVKGEVFPLMNEARHKKAFLVWTEGKTPEEVRAMQREMGKKRDKLTESDEWAPLTLRWHQVAGIRATLRMMAQGSSGVLIADEVGLGKTAQALGLIGMISHYIDAQERGKPVEVSPQLRLPEGRKLVSAPHVIISSATLMPNWLTEARTWLKGFEFFEYTGQLKSRRNFFGPNSAWAKAKSLMHMRIIFATTPVSEHGYSSDWVRRGAVPIYPAATQRAVGPSPTHCAPRTLVFSSGQRGSTAVTNDSANYFGSRPAQNSVSERLPLKKGVSKEVKESMHLLNSLVAIGLLILDESHEVRTGKNVFSAMLWLAWIALLTVGQSATPIYTHPKDMVYAGRALGIKGCMGEAVDAFERELVRKLARARRQEKTKLGNEPLGAAFDSASTATREIYIRGIRDIKTKFGDCIIRRTNQSKDNNGKVLGGLKDYIRVAAYLKLEDWELKIVNTLEKADHQASVSSLYFDTRKFYIRTRQGTNQPALVGYKEGSLADPPKQIDSEEIYDEVASTKTKTMIELVRYHLQQPSAAPAVFDEDGNMAFPQGSVPNDGGGPTKIVVYTDFPSLLGPLTESLDVHNIRYFVIHGGSFPRRVQRVGLTGINLACAHVLIIMDPLFSEQDKRQLIGRIWRFPQSLVCVIYDFIALATTDVPLSGIARKKEEMLQVFAKRSEYADELLAALRGDDIDDDVNYEPDVEEDEDEAPPGKAKTRGTRKPAATKVGAASSSRKDTATKGDAASSSTKDATTTTKKQRMKSKPTEKDKKSKATEKDTEGTIEVSSDDDTAATTTTKKQRMKSKATEKDKKSKATEKDTEGTIEVSSDDDTAPKSKPTEKGKQVLKNVQSDDHAPPKSNPTQKGKERAPPVPSHVGAASDPASLPATPRAPRPKPRPPMPAVNAEQTEQPLRQEDRTQSEGGEGSKEPRAQESEEGGSRTQSDTPGPTTAASTTTRSTRQVLEDLGFVWDDIREVSPERWSPHLHPAQLGSWFPFEAARPRGGVSFEQMMADRRFYDWNNVPDFDAAIFGPFDRIAVHAPGDPCHELIGQLLQSGWPNPPSWRRGRNAQLTVPKNVLCNTPAASWLAPHPAQISYWYPLPGLKQARPNLKPENYDPNVHYSYQTWVPFDANRYGPYDRVLQAREDDPSLTDLHLFLAGGFPAVPSHRHGNAARQRPTPRQSAWFVKWDGSPQGLGAPAPARTESDTPSTSSGTPREPALQKSGLAHSLAQMTVDDQLAKQVVPASSKGPGADTRSDSSMEFSSDAEQPGAGSPNEKSPPRKKQKT